VSTLPPKDDALIEQVLRQPESITFDCKRTGKVDKLLETVVAFANTEGGIIAIGIEDPDKASGRDRVYGMQVHLNNWDNVSRPAVEQEAHLLRILRTVTARTLVTYERGEGPIIRSECHITSLIGLRQPGGPTLPGLRPR